MKTIQKSIRAGLLVAMALALTSCEPNVYGSVGYSSWPGHGGGMGGSISVGGRICC